MEWQWKEIGIWRSKKTEEVKRRTGKLRREVVGRLNEGNMLESKIAQDRYLCLWPVKRLEVQPSCKGGFLE